MIWCCERLSDATGSSWAAITAIGNDTPLAWSWHGNLVTGGPDAAPHHASAPGMICWSGTLAATLFEGDPRNWMAPGRRAFESVLSRLTRGEHRSRVLLRPHARHLLSDIPSCVRLVRDHADAAGLAFAPMSLLEAPMLPDAADHLTRSFETLGPSAAIVFLHDVAPPADPESPLEPRPLGSGVVPRDLLRGLVRDCVRPGTTIVLPDGDVERQLAWIDAA